MDIGAVPLEQSPRLAQLSRRKVLSTGTSLLIAQVATAVSGIIIARALGPAGKGIVAAALVWPQISAWVLLLGLNTASSVRVSESRGALDHVLGNAVIYSLGVGALGTVGGLLVLPAMLDHLGPGAADAARITVLAIPVVMLAEVVAGINLGLGRVRHYNVARVLSGLLVLASSVVLVSVAAATPETLTAAGCLSWVVGLAVGAVGLPWRRVAIAVRAVRSDIAYGLRVFLTGLLALVNLRLDLLLMSAFLGARDIGFYSIATSAMLPVALVSATAASLIMPNIAVARGARGGESEDDVAFIRRTARRYSLITLAVAAVLAAILPVALPLIFGPEFKPAVALAWILLPGFVAQGYASIVDAGMVGMRTPWVGNLSQGAGVLITASLLPFLLPAYEAMGAAIVSSLAYTVSAGVALWASLRIHRADPAVPFVPPSPVDPFDVGIPEPVPPRFPPTR